MKHEKTIEQAAKTIFRFWYCKKNPLPKPLYFCLRDLKKANQEDIRQGNHDDLIFNIIKRCQLNNDRWQMHMLAYVLFSGDRYPSYSSYRNGELTCLLILLHDQDSSIHDVAFVLKDCFLQWKTREYRQPVVTQSDIRFPFGSGSNEINIYHGGGFFHMVEFLKKQSKGYRLEGPGCGIQVSPGSDSPTLDYSQRRSIFHFDHPAVLSAKIAEIYLDAANRGDEAGLRSDYIQYLSNIELTAYKPCWIGHLSVERAFYEDYPDIRAHIIESHEKLKAQFKAMPCTGVKL